MAQAPDLTVLATGLQFPEGPIAMADGTVLVVEIARGTLSRVLSDGHVEVVAETGGGPNGAAMGPDGACYVCNNGGFEWVERRGRIYPGEQAADYAGGRIERVELDTGKVEVLYTHANGVPLRGPNDLVFDAAGGFWFTDHGKTRPRARDRTGVFYAKADGSHVEEVIFPLEAPNGIGLSPNEDELYVAETPTGRLWAFPRRARPSSRRARQSARRRPLGGARPARLFLVRFVGRGCRRQRLHCHHYGWRHHRSVAGRRRPQLRADAGSAYYQHLLRRA